MEPVIARLLVDGAINEDTLAEGTEIAEGAGLPLFRVLLHLKLVDAQAAARAMSAATGRAVLSLDKWALPASPVPSFSAGLCRELRVLPLVFEAGEDGEQLVLAMADPTDQGAGERVASLLRCNVRPVLVDDTSLARAIASRYDAPPVEHTVMLLVEEISAEADVVAPDKTDEGAPLVSNEDVFTGFADAPAERTVIMRAPTHDHTMVARNPFLDPSSPSGETEMSSVVRQARVCFVSRDAKARLRVAADLAPLVRDAIIVEDLRYAVELTEGDAPDEVVVHDPKNDAGSGVLLERLARAVGQGVVVLSNDPSFAELPCVRRRLSLPTKAAEIAPLILEGLFAPNDEA